MHVSMRQHAAHPHIEQGSARQPADKHGGMQHDSEACKAFKLGSWYCTCAIGIWLRLGLCGLGAARPPELAARQAHHLHGYLGFW